MNRAVIVHRLKIPKENPPLEPPSKTPMMIDRHAHDDARQPDPERTIASESLDAAVSAHQRFLNDIFRVGRIPRRSDRNLKQKGTVLTSSRIKVNFFCSNSDRLHPPMSVVMTALRKVGFEIIS